MEIPITQSATPIQNPFPKEPATPKPGRPADWWSMENLHGTRDGVMKAIDSSSAPEYWKSAITAQIMALPAKFNFVRVDAHFHIHERNGQSVLSLSIVPSSALA